MSQAAVYRVIRFGVGGALIAFAVACASGARASERTHGTHRHAANAQERVLHSFAGGDDGALPSAGLVTDANEALYGTTQAGGVKNRGTVFKVMSARSQYQESVLYAFKGGKHDGALPVAGLIADASGALYGMTVEGGIDSSELQCVQVFVSYDGCGTVFKLTPSSSNPNGYVESVIYRFPGYPGSFWPLGGLVANGGVLYGATNWGGSPDGGTVFSLTPAHKNYRDQLLFALPNPSSGPADPDGYGPAGDLLVDASGALYGTAEWGGGCAIEPVSGCGAVFKLVPSASGYSAIFAYAFQGGNDGRWPLAGLVEDTSGALYGTTQYGGSANLGTVFKLTPSGSSYTESVVHSFGGGADGALPAAPLLLEANGTLFGTTPSGGSSNAGTIFKLTPSGTGYTERVIYAFGGGAGGAEPMAGLISCMGGSLCGTTMTGGTSGVGTVFSLDL